MKLEININNCCLSTSIFYIQTSVKLLRLCGAISSLNLAILLILRCSFQQCPRVFWPTKFPRVSTNQKHYLDLGNDVSSVGNFCACYSNVVLRGSSGDLAKRRLFSQATTPRASCSIYYVLLLGKSGMILIIITTTIT